MATYLALLRAVNVSGRNRVPMAALRSRLEQAGFDDPRTRGHSGNVVLDAPRRAAATLEEQIADEIDAAFGVRTEVFVRTAAQWEELVAANPFGRAAREDPSHLLALLLHERTSAAAVGRLEAAVSGREEVVVVGRMAYVVYPDGIAGSKLTNAKIERALGTPVTGRNWNVVLDLAELARARA